MKRKYPRFFIVKSKYTLARVSMLLEEYDLYQTDLSNDTFLLLGYRTLSLEAKETYRLLRNLTVHSNKKKKTTLYAEVSLEYLALVFNTTPEAQSARIQQLIKHGLVESEKTSKQYNRYHILEPVIDSTFVHTIIQIIRRKRLGLLGYKYASSKNTKEKIEILQEMLKAEKKGAKHFKSSTITEMWRSS